MEYLIISIAVSVVLALILFFVMKNMIGNNRYVTTEEYEVILDKLQKRITILERQVKKLQAKQNDERNERPVIQESVTVGLTNVKDEDTVTVVSKPASPETFYLAAPTMDGRFTKVSPTLQMGHSIYQLDTQDGTNGTFVLLNSSDAVATALISVSQFVKPVCKVLAQVSNPRKITTVEKGNAVLEDGTWRVTSKASVRLE